jgi:hypothetical protein
MGTGGFMASGLGSGGAAASMGGTAAQMNAYNAASSQGAAAAQNAYNAAGGTGGLTAGGGGSSAWGTAGGYLRAGAKGAYNFANSPIGKEVISQGLKGYMEGKQQEIEWERDDRRLYGDKGEMDELAALGAGGEFMYRDQAAGRNR